MPANRILVDLVVVLVFAGSAAAAEDAKPDSKLPKGFAGSEACALCHEEVVKAFEKNPHRPIEKSKARGWEGRSCESCHGPGAKHADSADPADIRNPGKLAPTQSDPTCLVCHRGRMVVVGTIRQSHADGRVGCVACHTVHAPRKLTNAEKNQKCSACHFDAWASFQRPHRHRVPEGAISCTDCHNPHSKTRPTSLRLASANEPGCFRCHGDKRGPFAYEHAPVRFDGCTTCHEPHGSVNPRMLTRQEVRLTCLECHANVGTPSQTIGSVPAAFHDLRSPRFRNCTTCHVKIHGSHFDREFLR